MDAPDPDLAILLERSLAPVVLSAMLRPPAVPPGAAMLAPLKAVLGFPAEVPAWLVKPLAGLALKAAGSIAVSALFRLFPAAGGRSLRPRGVIPVVDAIPARPARSRPVAAAATAKTT
jgi:hypothetical protein